MSKIQDSTIQKLVAELHQQSNNCGTSVEDFKEFQVNFKGGETIKALEKTHPLYSEKHGRVYPFYEEDDGVFDVDQDLFDGVEGCVANLAHHWRTLCMNIKPENRYFLHYYEMFDDAIYELARYHPEYNCESGEIEPGYKAPARS